MNERERPSGASQHAALEDRIHLQLSEQLENEMALADGRQFLERRELTRRAAAILSEKKEILTAEQSEAIVRAVVDRIIGLGPLEPLLEDTSITEIMVNDPQSIFIERQGKIEEVDVRFRDEAHLRHVIDRIVAPIGRRIDESSPLVDARLPDGSRVNAVIPPLAIGGPALTIRKFSREPFTLQRLIDLGTISQEMADYLDQSVKDRVSILVSGGTGSGKTSTLNALGYCIPATERLITIEDAAELQLDHEDLVSMEARPPNIEGRGEITIRTLVRNALRMRPDRIIVGEVRGGEAFDMLQAMNTGHRGSMTTLHANSPPDALIRLESMVLMAGFDMPVTAIRRMISGAVEIIVQQDRLPDGSRVVTAIAALERSSGDALKLQPVFLFDVDKGRHYRSKKAQRDM
ncbi:MAG: CpaF family protein [Anaerolineales bacterium]|jgi:pilus assembly protein CpaF